jgi:hypothetical protein
VTQLATARFDETFAKTNFVFVYIFFEQKPCNKSLTANIYVVTYFNLIARDFFYHICASRQEELVFRHPREDLIDRLLPNLGDDLIERLPHVRVNRQGVLVERLHHFLGQLFVPIDDIVKTENNSFRFHFKTEISNAQVLLVLLGEPLAFDVVLAEDLV